ncbi:MAG: hypothetical protein JXI43_09235 [Tissierellales bacterium]|nr:hypothetical protein [Tissierellales bacterium]
MQGSTDFFIERNQLLSTDNDDSSHSTMRKMKDDLLYGKPLHIRPKSNQSIVTFDCEYLGLATLSLDSGTTVQLNREKNSSKLKMIFFGDSLKGKIYSNGPIQLGTNMVSLFHDQQKLDKLPNSFALISPKPIQFQSGNSPLTISIEIDKEKLFEINGFFFIDKISFTEKKSILESTIKGGIINFAEFSDVASTLKQGDYLELKCNKDCIVKNIKISNTISANISGWFKNIESGAVGLFHSIKPSILQYLYYKNEIAILIIVFAAGIALLNNISSKN